MPPLAFMQRCWTVDACAPTVHDSDGYRATAMRIVSYNVGHDGATALIEDGRLTWCLEGEKDNGLRHAMLSPTLFVRSLQGAQLADVLAISGWHREAGRFQGRPIDGGYLGLDQGARRDTSLTVGGKGVRQFASSHERSHLMCSYGMSPFEQGEPCYALLWEGVIGSFYHIDSRVRITRICEVMREPGHKYSLLYSIADPSARSSATDIRLDDAGKLMALAAYGRAATANERQRELIERILSLPRVTGTAHKEALRDTELFDIGVESQPFKDVARLFTDALFERFHASARQHLRPGLPLLIAGGCGLNCEWNTRWKECGLFRDVFVPPCTNDSGVALGAGIDALHLYSGRAKIDWSVYAGEEFVVDTDAPAAIAREPLDLRVVSELLNEGAVIGWVQGRYEIGPRALGNRSILAAPFKAEMRERLNSIKQRERFRPIAPICMAEELDRHFEHTGASPYMLYFQRVKSPQLAAVTHVDGTARAQTVSAQQNPQMHALLAEFRRSSGFGVLCNTSLNFKGYGFINRMSDLVEYAQAHRLDAFVVGDQLYRLAPRRAQTVTGRSSAAVASVEPLQGVLHT